MRARLVGRGSDTDRTGEVASLLESVLQEAVEDLGTPVGGRRLAGVLWQISSLSFGTG